MYSRKRQNDYEILIKVEDDRRSSSENRNGILAWLIENYGVLPLVSCLILITSLIALVLCIPFINLANTNNARGRYQYQNVINKTKLTNVTDFNASSLGIATILAVEVTETEINLNSEKIEDLEKFTDSKSDKNNATSQSTDKDDFLEENIVMSGSDTVGFLLPLRGFLAEFGFALGRPVRTSISNMVTRNETNLEVLVRDTQTDSDLSKKFMKHFYDSHGTRVFYGLLTDDEALSVSAWGRSHTPGAKFISPTATSHLLEKSYNFVSVQPSAKFLVAAIADFLSLTSSTNDVIIVTLASISNDAIISQLKALGIEPLKVIYYYAWNEASPVLQHLKPPLAKCPHCLVIILSDLGSAKDLIAAEGDSSFKDVTWVLPFASQWFQRPESHRSNVVSFRFRPHDFAPKDFLKPDELLNPLNATLNASLHLILGGEKNWKGSYVVTLFKSSESIPNPADEFSPLPMDDGGGQPMIEYQVKEGGLLRRHYEHLALTTQALQNLTYTRSEKCELVVRFVEESTGEIKVRKVPLSSAILVPVTRGAQIHLDCHDQHLDIQCRMSEGNLPPLLCEGLLFGDHNLSRCAKKEAKVQLKTFKGCSFVRKGSCRNKPKSFECRISKMCSDTLRTKGTLTCNGLKINELT